MATALKGFCDRHRISVRKLATICGDRFGKSSLHRLMQGTADPNYVARVLPNIVLCLAAFLAAKGIQPEDIQAELRAAFPQLDNSLEPPIASSATCILRNPQGRIVNVIEISI